MHSNLNLYTITTTKNESPFTNMKTIYIAGKVSGLPIHTTTIKFGEAQKKLSVKYPNAKIYNPLLVVNDWHCPWHVAMQKCLEALLASDMVYMLSDWQDSKGARLEHHVAQTIGKDISYEDASTADIGNKYQPYFY